MKRKEIAEFEAKAKDASELLTAMANQNRLLILCHLLQGETSVNALAEAIGMSQSALSQQLAKLRALKIVETRRDGQLIHYRLSAPEVEKVLETLYGIYCAPKNAVA
ncbi:ArsR/SmtB family transcription factor [Nitratireductor indicus]|uniref:Ars family transcriptional regulator n=1 Tax=Nitratireductor indicus C115 TaxID=1231190 RepID=K2NYR1_9HYPH|nr:metalloregulator ArsR/SmtB family transcription factor [Nitratireductor indicus]EKF43004.1 Ars family transcriptional regulator [Nitratireductor indicus C115]MDS1137560.1 metalloregulator ArsR/SmtB family transcription factor [Nitratireductor indicus]SFQ51910.1 DNA-binding transcriptional regulator, ArsR family [Nitratireductor indicus]